MRDARIGIFQSSCATGCKNISVYADFSVDSPFGQCTDRTSRPIQQIEPQCKKYQYEP